MIPASASRRRRDRGRRSARRDSGSNPSKARTNASRFFKMVSHESPAWLISSTKRSNSAASSSEREARTRARDRGRGTDARGRRRSTLSSLESPCSRRRLGRDRAQARRRSVAAASRRRRASPSATSPRRPARRLRRGLGAQALGERAMARCRERALRLPDARLRRIREAARERSDLLHQAIVRNHAVREADAQRLRGVDQFAEPAQLERLATARRVAAGSRCRPSPGGARCARTSRRRWRWSEAIRRVAGERQVHARAGGGSVHRRDRVGHGSAAIRETIARAQRSSSGSSLIEAARRSASAPPCGGLSPPAQNARPAPVMHQHAQRPDARAAASSASRAARACRRRRR